MPTEVRRMIRLYKESYEGPAWSGSALKEYLEEFDPEYADLHDTVVEAGNPVDVEFWSQ